MQWYPSAGRDLKNIAFYYSNAIKKKRLNIEIPNLFVHTDFNYDETFELQANDIYTETLENEVFKITVIERCEYDTNFTPYFEANYVAYRNNSMDGKALLLKLNIETENKDSHVVYLLYCYLENINFFKRIIIKSKVSIDQLCTIREGSGLGGGGVISNKFFAFYLGYMQCKYWFTDVIGRNMKSMTKLNEQDTILEDAYNSVYNKSTALTGLNFIGNGVTAFKTGGVGDNITVSIPGLIEVVPPLIISGGTDQIISTSVYPGRLMGRAAVGSIGPMQEIQVGTGLSLSAGGVLTNTSISAKGSLSLRIGTAILFFKKL